MLSGGEPLQQREITRLKQELENWQLRWRSVETSSGWRLLCAWRSARDRVLPESTRRRRIYERLIARLRASLP